MREFTSPFIKDPDYFDRKIRAMWFSGGGLGATFHTHGREAGAEGVWNAQGQVRIAYDAPVVTTWKTGAFQDGSTQKSKKNLHRDLELGFHITETEMPPRTAEDNESEFRKIFDYEPDPWDDDPEPTRLHIETERSGERMLDLMLSEAPICDFDVDPIEQQYFNLLLKLRAGQPFWYEADVVTSFKSGASAADGYIEIENPTDQPLRHKWVLTRATWTLPDFSWRGGKYRRRPGGLYKSRTITLPPLTDVQGGAVVSLDSRDLHIRDVHYTNLLPLLGGQYFQHIIPPYTPRQQLPISFKDAPAGGAMAQLVQPRRWSRPWGLE
ncbi:minor tail protein [Mycobacterium phage DS6A]|uniref:Minor tail subunit n=1 Tax=Mycobacterium phage DS6A TaxID=45764 RepID=G8I4D0_9CAUD|nr:minor tail protein [Mycobacterium phage DS6A]AER47574.1 minor tail subunit [Mycobacterium phage DS6A]